MKVAEILLCLGFAYSVHAKFSVDVQKAENLKGLRIVSSEKNVPEFLEDASIIIPPDLGGPEEDQFTDCTEIRDRYPEATHQTGLYRVTIRDEREEHHRYVILIPLLDDTCFPDIEKSQRNFIQQLITSSY